MAEFGSFEYLRDLLRIRLKREDGLVHVRCSQCDGRAEASGPFLRTEGVTAAKLRETVLGHIADHTRELSGVPARYKHEVRD